VQKGPTKESLQGQEGPDALLQEAIKWLQGEGVRRERLLVRVAGLPAEPQGPAEVRRAGHSKLAVGRTLESEGRGTLNGVEYNPRSEGKTTEIGFCMPSESSRFR